MDAIQNHIGSLNFGYRVALRNKGVKYINALGQLQDAHTIKVRRGRRGGGRGRRSMKCHLFLFFTLLVAVHTMIMT